LLLREELDSWEEEDSHHERPPAAVAPLVAPVPVT